MVRAILEAGEVRAVDPLPSDWKDGQQLVVDQALDDQIQREFDELTRNWQTEKRYQSFSKQIAMHPAYQRIIGMGRSALPLIFRELERGPHHWFWALRAITGVDPVPEESRGDLAGMTEAWLRWGTSQGLTSRN